MIGYVTKPGTTPPASPAHPGSTPGNNPGDHKSSARMWLAGARLVTLSAAIAPVIAGSAAAYQAGSANLKYALMALVVAVFLQIGVNFANDYSDGIRGTDAHRQGPARLTGGGQAKPQTVRNVAFAAFGIAAITGFALVYLTASWWLLLAGGAAIIAAWYYTGGKNPYGYRGLGEVGVFLFFGLLATLGTTWVQAQRLTWQSLVIAVLMGTVSCALLMVNNIRDIPSDTLAGKHTLAVRLGQRRARQVFAAEIALTYICVAALAVAQPWVAISLVALPRGIFVIHHVLSGARGPQLLPSLRDTAMIQMELCSFIAVAYTLG